MSKRRQSDAETEAAEQVEQLAHLVSMATTGAYIDLFPHHEGATEFFAVSPELKAQREAYYREIARRLVAKGVRVA